jgi:hypothetical protein
MGKNRMDRSQLSRVIAIAVLGVATFSCGSRAGKTVTSGEVHLTLAEFQLEDAQGRPLSMSSDGAVTGPNGPWGRIHQDGTVTSADGSVRGKLLKTGVVTDAHGAEIATIADDGSAKLGNVELRFGEDGKLVGGNPQEQVRIRTQTPEARRAAMLVLVMTELGGK